MNPRHIKNFWMDLRPLTKCRKPATANRCYTVCLAYGYQQRKNVWIILSGREKDRHKIFPPVWFGSKPLNPTQIKKSPQLILLCLSIFQHSLVLTWLCGKTLFTSTAKSNFGWIATQEMKVKLVLRSWSWMSTKSRIFLASAVEWPLQIGWPKELITTSQEKVKENNIGSASFHKTIRYCLSVLS